MNETDIPPPPASRTKNVLRTLQLVALHNWVLAHASHCRTVSDTKLAQIASAELEFTVTPANLAGMREEIGIEKAKKESPATLETRVMTLEEQVAGMNNRFTSLQSLLDELQARLTGLSELAKARDILNESSSGPIDLPLDLQPSAPSAA